MSKLNITKGEWRQIKKEGLFPWVECDNFNQGHLSVSTTTNGAQNLANAQLIADAGTTANKCGLLPSELLKQRNELLNALNKVLNKSHDSRISHASKLDVIEVITYKAIRSCES